MLNREIIESFNTCQMNLAVQPTKVSVPGRCQNEKATFSNYIVMLTMQVNLGYKLTAN